ncbi:MAG: hypothetical protein JNJ39_16705 [Blastocatellia bacterium]|nr:hypothetical protein [Blastocatellia bacterium]
MGMRMATYRSGLSGYRQIVFCLLVSVFLLVCAGVTSAQVESNIQAPSSERIDELLDILFPRASANFVYSKHAFAMDVREVPSFRAPTQVSIFGLPDGSIITHRYELADSKRSLGEQLLAILDEQKNSDFRFLKERLKPVRIEVTRPRMIKFQVRDFFTKISFRPSNGAIRLDSVSYEVWYIDSGSEVHFSLSGSERFEANEAPIISWARRTIASTITSK